ncbi:acyl carrier protein [Opitutaceae bacterium TAV4]|uniref:acyl carrier protein n=1 Tax=Geminisphaera colitermitum TaxID=1148786 RepID=UPI0001964EFC|nr:acyl carrier protein [Geminisphaera colitermitum]RRJ95120.1 acyl carrier protein [Opitutaceae bacterium TAV4]RRJ99379.1 acyl carrier protein [Opitutaceae bacterium TAV3]
MPTEKAKPEILAELKEHLKKLFDIAPDTVTPESRIYQDLGLDSIDAVDLVVQLQRATGRKIKPEEFKAVRTVSDVVDAIHKLVNSPPPSGGQ